MNPLKALHDHGQSVWLDFIRRNLIKSGELGRLIDRDGVRGVTSNPSIFEKAIAGSGDYTESLAAAPREWTAMQVYESLAIADIRDAAEVLRPVYEQSSGRDGYVSLEVSPYLADKTAETVNEARRLWRAVDRPNLMIKVPATAAGIPAIRTLISEGINVNVTLLFAQETYEAVAQAYIAGLAERARAGADVSKIASVASFFVSRIDTLVDGMIDKRIASNPAGADRAAIEGLRGKIAIANAKLAYQRYLRLYRSEHWQALAAKGAQTQRLLWASTSTKNPSYRDVMYVEELIGPETVNTIPPATMDAFREHGAPRETLTEGIDRAGEEMDALARAGISMKEVTDRLVQEGVKLFADAFDQLLAAVTKATGAKA
jgi:transaldolase/glucose-6-phosphate isomerase